jgi:hypothetical protein
MLQLARRTEPAFDALDSALIDLADYGPELANGFTSHAPMVAEALDALGRGDAILPWIERYRAMMRPWPERVAPIADRPAAPGDPHRVTDWRDFFLAELAEWDWREVLARWVPRLAPGASGGALHGLIRTGHAARSLGRAETEPRRAELAAALASWAADYAELPIAGALGAVPMSAAAALSRLPFLPAERRRNGGSIVAALEALAGHMPFARAWHWLAIDDAEATVRDLGGLFARVFLGNVDSPLHAIVFTHAVTGTAAAGHLLPYVTDEEGRALVRHVWHASCALYAAYGFAGPEGAGGEILPPGELANRAIANGDDHAIKLTEAVLALRLEPALATAVAVRAMEFL